MTARHLPPESRRLLAELRDTRFRDGVFCPHCRSPEVGGWGMCRGRRRYRCRACRRTFSDLTGTLFAWTKRLDRWPAYLECVGRAETLRRISAELGIHLCTSFRWRHRLLEPVRDFPATPLMGAIQVGNVVMRESRKGQKGASEWRSWRPAVRLLIARSRFGAQIYGLAAGIVDPAVLRHVVVNRVSPGCTLFAAEPLARPLRTAAIGSGCEVIRTPAPWSRLVDRERCVDDVWNEGRNFRRWLIRFRGVATRYLLNYAAWHELLRREALRPRGGDWLCRVLSHLYLPRFSMAEFLGEPP